MKTKQSPPPGATELRLQAEARLKSKPAAAGQPPTEAELRRLHHELEVHQIELEMQNEELLRAQVQTEAALERFTDLYDFAPTGYFSLTCEGTILAVNLTGARFVGIERARLLNQNFGFLISEGDRPPFNAFLQKIFAGKGREICEATLPREGTSPLYVRMEGVLSRDGRECRISLLDLTERVLLEGRLRKAEAMLRMLVANSLEPMALIDDMGTLLCMSTRAATLLGYTPGELEGTAVTRLLYNQDRLSLALQYADLQKHAPLPATALLRVNRKSGDFCWVSVTATFEDYGQIPGKYLVKFDVIDLPGDGSSRS